MKRWRFQLVLCLLLGAIINFAVAWGMCYFDKPGTLGPERCGNVPTASGECLTFLVSHGSCVEQVEWLAGGDVVRRGDAGETIKPPLWCWVPGERGFRARDVPGHEPGSRWVEGAAGWPLKSMRWCLERHESQGRIVHTPRRLAILLPKPPPGAVRLVPPRVLPMDPVWLGFMANTICYGAVLWLITGGPLAVRRSMRLKRGQCGACGYPTGTSRVCTECGKPVTPRSVVSSTD